MEREGQREGQKRSKLFWYWNKYLVRSFSERQLNNRATMCMFIHVFVFLREDRNINFLKERFVI